MKKRGLSLFLALVLCLTLLPATAWAVGEDTTAAPWDGTADTNWYKDTETTFTLTTAEQLAGLASLVNGGTTFSGVTITLGADIVLNEDGATSPNNWTPIGKDFDNAFTGTFDGQGHTIKGLYIKSTSFGYVGLFGCVGTGGTVKNLAVEGAVNASFGSYVRVGGVVGSNSGGTVETCSFTGAVSGSGGIAYVGGVVGSNEETVKNCCHTGEVTATASNRDAYVGGVVGENTRDFISSSDGSTVNCYHTGNVTATATGDRGSAYAGGVVGHMFSGTTVSNCYFLQDTNLNGIGSSSSNTGAEPKTATEFASGKVAWLLSGGDENSPWRQNLASYLPTGSTASDDVPTLDSTHLRVTTTSSGGYTNTLGTATGEDGYYEIYSAAQLYAFASAVNGGSSTINAKLMADIDLSSVCGATIGENGTSWTPIVNDEKHTFRGTFDGQGNRIENLYINSTSSVYAGLFGYVGTGGTVKNLNVKGTVTAETSAGNLYVGGVVGYAYTGSTVDNCSFSGAVTGTGRGSSSDPRVGGVVGYAYGSATVKNCSNSGAVTAESKHVSSAGGVVGGVSGGNSGQVTVENCRNTGAVSNTSNAGSGGVSVYTGGVVGYACYADVNNCYNTGEVKSACASSATSAANNTGCGETGYLRNAG